MENVIIVGGGISGLTLALSLHQAGVSCRVYEAAPRWKRLGVGINLLPHGIKELTDLGLQQALESRAVETREMSYYSQHGEFIYSEPRGRFAGYSWPQFSIHRGVLHEVLAEAVGDRLGENAIVLNHKCIGFEQGTDGVTVQFVDAITDEAVEPVRGRAAAACDGIHSAVRKQLFPSEGAPSYKGINMWRGVSRWKPFLSGATMVQAGWLEVGKIVIYPISHDLDSDGNQLINWVAEIQSPRNVMQDWNLPGKFEDFLSIFANWQFPWLDVPALIEAADAVLEYPMVDRDPLPYWTANRVTLVGDAAHPMYPRGGNGAGQGILDVRALAKAIAATPDHLDTAFKAYEAERLGAANNVVLANRSTPPDVILQVVHERSGGKPFGNIDDLISREELAAITDNYKKVAGFDKATLSAKDDRVPHRF
jgi:2-polyprenyl-6-methoxyphenol hydroxylase-like FAD-dependent oxidoreductase